MKKVKYCQCLIAAFYFVCSSVTVQAFNCDAVYSLETKNRESIFAKARKILDVQSPSTTREIYDFFLELQGRSDRKVLVKSFLIEFNVINQHKMTNSSAENWSRIFRSLLRIVDGSLKDWTQFLLRENHLEIMSAFNSFGLAGHLMSRLPKFQRMELISTLGPYYLTPFYKRKLTQPLHVLSNPVRSLNDSRANGVSDRVFYDLYIKRLQYLAFPEGGHRFYSGELVVEIVSAVTDFLNQQTSIKYVAFLGSVPNGLGRERSDLDIFNHPVVNHTSSNRSSDKDSMDLRYPINDSQLQQSISSMTAGTLGRRWHLVDSSVRLPDEHFVAEGHIFMFVVGRNSVELRFYDNYIRTDIHGNPLDPYHYQTLDMTFL